MPKRELADPTRPDNEQRDTADDEPGGQAPPEPDDPVICRKAEGVTKRQADEPVPGEIPEHRRPRVSQPAQHAGGNALHAIEQLKDRRNQQQGGADLEHAGIPGESSDEKPWSDEERYRRARHECDAEEQGRPPGAPSRLGISTPDSVTHVYCTRSPAPE